jgi:hypothetical protein
MGHPHLICCWQTADSSCLALLARRNDKMGGCVYFRGIGASRNGTIFLTLGIVGETIQLEPTWLI